MGGVLSYGTGRPQDLEGNCKSNSLQLRDNAPSRKQRRRRLQATKEYAECPFRTCRAPELATGTALRLQASVLDADICFFLDAMAAAPPSKRAELSNTWTASRSRMWGHLCMKLSFWQQLPWHLCLPLRLSASAGRRAPELILGRACLQCACVMSPLRWPRSERQIRCSKGCRSMHRTV